MEYYNSKPEITSKLIQDSIASTWSKYKEQRTESFYNTSQLTYFIFDNLFRVVRLRPELMKVTYDTLIQLNKREENIDMVQHLENKKQEYFSKENLQY